MASNIALYIAPLALARTREKLDDVFAGWAERRRRKEMAIRVSGPAELPNTDYPVWRFETTDQILPVLLDDLTLRVRAVVALRINLDVGRAIAQVHARDRGHPLQTRADRPEDIEPIVASALGAFVGPLDVPAGWLEPWLAAHETAAELRCVHWNYSRTQTTAWPSGYSPPTEKDWRFFEGIYDESLMLGKAHC